MNFVLIGLMGVGKTRVGKRLAERSGWSFIDTDFLIEESWAMTVSRIFEHFGEPLFRRMEKVRVVVADSQVLVREGICALLKTCEDIEVVGETGNGNETIAAVEREDPEVVLVESALPVMDGAAVTRRLRREIPSRTPSTRRERVTWTIAAPTATSTSFATIRTDGATRI